MEVGLMTAIGHAALSVALGFAVLGVGYEFSNQAAGYVTEAIGLAMLIGGLVYALRGIKTKEEEDYAKEAAEGLSVGEARFGKRFRYFAVLGAALSPDLAILPVFLLAIPIGLSFAVATALVFGLASIAALLLFISLGMAGLARVFERIPPKYNDVLVGLVIAVVGAYILLVG